MDQPSQSLDWPPKMRGFACIIEMLSVPKEGVWISFTPYGEG